MTIRSTGAVLPIAGIGVVGKDVIGDSQFGLVDVSIKTFSLVHKSHTNFGEYGVTE